ncbi:pterin-4a-carbinolamine dehydratase [Massilia violacea]|uniref:Pterin-4a-carbinolamine dehydratase n=1 Tax=Pseudoduganella violacea TaxID=1715466 RepID=A0A7W5BBX3_9BURK|nr:pterin-4a-carbinolamine dehydratase [Pseudoduganella violacea]
MKKPGYSANSEKHHPLVSVMFRTTLITAASRRHVLYLQCMAQCM